MQWHLQSRRSKKALFAALLHQPQCSSLSKDGMERLAYVGLNAAASVTLSV
jgi:hypothetical protein